MAAPLQLAPPPRAVPVSLVLRLLASGVLSTIGWLFFGLGLVFASLFLRFAESPFADPFAGSTQTVNGTVVEITATSASVNNDRIHAVKFEYAAGGRTMTGVSYTGGPTPAVGAAVPVELATTSAATARIRGMRTAMFPGSTWLILLFPAAGAVFLLVTMVRGWRRVQLLKQGIWTRGRLVDRRATNVRINKQTVYELTFRFRDERQQEREGKVRSHVVSALTDDAEEALLYDPIGSRIVLWDMLPGRPEVDEQGQLRPLGIGNLLPVLLPPTLVAIAWTVVQAAPLG